MDSKPQKLRGGPLRLRDENVPLMEVGALKTIHQRNKSTSALSLMKGINANPHRRTAFADISNTRNMAVAKDDMHMYSKQVGDMPSLKAESMDSQDVQPELHTSKSKALLRPAQRPLSAAIHKSLPAEPVSTMVTLATTKNTVIDPSVEPALVRKTVTKRQTTVFKEVAPSAIASLASTVFEAKPLPPVHQILSAPSSATSYPSVIPHDNASSATEKHSKLLKILQLKDNIDSKDAEPIHQPVSDILDSIQDSFTSEVLKSLADLNEPNPVPPPVSFTLPEPTPFEAMHNEPVLQENYVPALEIPASVLDNALDEKLAHQGVNEVEEYWDEEEDEEYFDAEGYTTARSIRSRGDNTTGGMTVVLAPRVTARVERELAAAKAFVDSTRPEDDIEDEAWDTTMVAEYGDEIFSYMRDLENRMIPNPYYMENQAEIQWSMRSVLMDWLTQVHARFGLLPETLFLAVNYVDRFLSCKIVSLGKLQLVGATAIFLAAKYEEINCPSVQEIVYMVDGGYTVDEILKAERFMLSMLKFELGWPGPMSFLRRISKADDYDLETRTLAKYFMEITIMDERFVGCIPSFVAAGAHCLARLMLRKGDWGPAHVYYSQYTYSQLRNLISIMLECCENPRKHHAAVYDKYTDKKFKRAAIFVESEIQKGFELPTITRESINGFNQSLRRK